MCVRYVGLRLIAVSGPRPGPRRWSTLPWNLKTPRSDIQATAGGHTCVSVTLYATWSTTCDAEMAAPGPADTEKAMKMAQQEMDYRVDLYNRWVLLKIPRVMSLCQQHSCSRDLTQCLCVQDGCVMLRQMHGQKVSTRAECSIAIALSLPAQAWQRPAAS